LVGFMLLFGAVGWAGAENPSEPALAPLWTEARRGDHDAQYRLGRQYESRYWLAERDPDGPAGDPIDVVLAYGLFRMAEQSGELDALYGRHSTEYRLKQVFGNDILPNAIAGLPDWMRAPGPPSYPGGAAAAAFLTPEALLARGNAYLDEGDPVSARVFFEMAVELGSGKAAVLMAMTYDPEYLASLGTTPGSDPDLAAAWYRKASEMGYEGATARLQGLRHGGQEVSQ
jgi:TPR repeat protein